MKALVNEHGYKHIMKKALYNLPMDWMSPVVPTPHNAGLAVAPQQIEIEWAADCSCREGSSEVTLRSYPS